MISLKKSSLAILSYSDITIEKSYQHMDTELCKHCAFYNNRTLDKCTESDCPSLIRECKKRDAYYKTKMKKPKEAYTTEELMEIEEHKRLDPTIYYPWEEDKEPGQNTMNDLYQYYISNCERDNESYLNFEDWIKYREKLRRGVKDKEAEWQNKLDSMTPQELVEYRVRGK
jgi:superfamily I DNA/RNA helicase